MSATITIQQQPQAYNLVVGSNVWTLGSITSNEDAYVLRIEKYSEVTGATTIATIQQPANPAGVAHFDVSKMLQSYMSIAFVEETGLVNNDLATPTLGETLTYRIRYGSITNDVITFDGYSTVKHVFNGYVDWRELNWTDDGKYIPNPNAVTCEGPNAYIDAQYVARTTYLTNYPGDIPVRSSTWHTLSFFNRIGNYNNGTNWGNSEQPFAVRVKFYDADGTLISTSIKALSVQTGLGPRLDFDSNLPLVYNDWQWIGTLGAGPQNLIENNMWPSNASTPAIWNLVSQQWGNYSQIWNLASTTAIVDSYIVEVVSVNMCYWDLNGAPEGPGATTLEPYLGDIIYTKSFQITNPCTGYEPITVSFVNKYGVKDYFTFDRRNTYNQRIARNDYTQTLGTWSAATFEIDPHGRGRRTFSTKIETEMSMNSYWMGDEESAWLEELFTSPHIQVYYNGVWEPAVITSNTYTQKTNTRDGLFQHTLNVKFANNKRVQRG